MAGENQLKTQLREPDPDAVVDGGAEAPVAFSGRTVGPSAACAGRFRRTRPAWGVVRDDAGIPDRLVCGRGGDVTAGDSFMRKMYGRDVLLHRDGLRERSDDGIGPTGPACPKRFRAGDGRAVLLDCSDRACRVATKLAGVHGPTDRRGRRDPGRRTEFFGYPRVNAGARPDWEPGSVHRIPLAGSPAGRTIRGWRPVTRSGSGN